MDKTFDISLWLDEAEAHVDPLRMEQMLINLLNNGRQAMPVGEGSLTGSSIQ